MTTAQSPRPPLPPFDAESAAQKVRMAEDAWNTRDPVRVALVAKHLKVPRAAEY